MRFTKFEISNFKGIEYATISLPTAQNPVVALIGLNESGKTTLLEAMANFLSEDEDVSALYPRGNQSKNLHDFVPKGKKANFSGNITIRAELKLSQIDIESVSTAMRAQYSIEIDKSTFPTIITVGRTHVFKSSVYSTSTRNWTLNYMSRSGTQRKYRAVGHEANNQEWNNCIKILSTMFPKICYFPSFQFDFPERIYLTPSDGEPPLQPVYRSTIDDVLKFSDKNLSIKTHVVDRISAFKTANAEKNWKELYGESDTKKQVDAVLQKIENEMGKSVFTAWNAIFTEKIQNKVVEIELRFDFEKDDIPFIAFSIKDGPTRYALSERSLGFRWFFSFLLFTRFRRARGGAPTLFLFDEPASNLHAKAQMKLLESFSQIITGESGIIYYTHSQYMIDPIRLDQSYIV